MYTLSHMRLHNIPRDKYTYTHILTACTRSRPTSPETYDTACRLYALLAEDSVEVDHYICANLLRVAASAVPVRVEDAIMWFGAVKKPNRVMCNVMMDLYARVGDVNGCRAMWRYMGRRGMRADEYTCSALVKVHVMCGDVEEGLNVIAEMRSAGVNVSSAAFGIVIDAYGKCGRLEDAVRVFDLMTLWGIAPTRVTYNILIAACAYDGRGERAFDIFEEMTHTSGIYGDRYTYHALMKCCFAMREPERVLSLYRDIRKSPFRCNQVSFRYALQAAAIGLDVDAIWEIQQDMKEGHCKAREDTAAMMLVAAVRCSDVEGAIGVSRDFTKGLSERRARSFFDAARAAVKIVTFEQDFGLLTVVNELERNWLRGLRTEKS